VKYHPKKPSMEDYYLFYFANLPPKKLRSRILLMNIPTGAVWMESSSELDEWIRDGHFIAFEPRPETKKQKLEDDSAAM
jgi:hypothetical protein